MKFFPIVVFLALLAGANAAHSTCKVIYDNPTKELHNAYIKLYQAMKKNVSHFRHTRSNPSKNLPRITCKIYFKSDDIQPSQSILKSPLKETTGTAHIYLKFYEYASTDHSEITARVYLDLYYRSNHNSISFTPILTIKKVETYPSFGGFTLLTTYFCQRLLRNLAEPSLRKDHEIRVMASTEKSIEAIGAYVWANIGFDYDEDPRIAEEATEVYRINDRFIGWIKQALPDYYRSNQVKLENKISRFAHPWEIADFSLALSNPALKGLDQSLRNHHFIDQKQGTYRLGKAFLTGQSPVNSKKLLAEHKFDDSFEDGDQFEDELEYFAKYFPNRLGIGADRFNQKLSALLRETRQRPTKNLGKRKRDIATKTNDFTIPTKKSKLNGNPFETDRTNV